jgi:hypothetical protein
MLRKIHTCSKHGCNIALIIIALFVLSFGYLFSLIVIKPRSVPIVITLIESALQEISPNLHIKADSAILKWDKEGYKFDLSLAKVEIVQGGNVVAKLPETSIDLSMRNLLIGRFKLDGIIIKNPVIRLDASEKGNVNIALDEEISYKLDIEKYLPVILNYDNLSSYMVGDVQIKNANLIIKTSKRTINWGVKDFELSSKKFRHEAVLHSRMDLHTENNKTELEASCFIGKRGGKSCSVDFRYLTAEVLTEISPENIFSGSNLSLNGHGKFNFNDKTKLENVEYNISSFNGDIAAKGILAEKIPFNRIILEGEFLENFTKHNISSLKIVTYDAEANLTSQYSKGNLGKDFKVNFTVDGQIDIKNHMAKYWPLIAAPEVRQWVIEHMISGKVHYVAMQLEFAQKPEEEKLTLSDMQGEYLFSNAMLDFDAGYLPLTNLEGRVALQTNALHINIANGSVNDNELQINNVNAEIKDFTKSDLLIEGKVSGSAKGLARFLLARKVKDIDTLANSWGSINSATDFKILIPLNATHDFKQYLVAVRSDLTNVNYAIFKGDSMISTVVNKPLADDNFYISNDLTESFIDFSNLSYLKQKEKAAKLDLTYHIDDKKASLKDIKYRSKDVVIDGSMAFRDGIITNLDFPQLQFSQNDFSVKFTELKKGTYKLDVLGNSINLSNNFPVKSSQKKTSDFVENVKINISLKKILMANNNILNDLNAAFDCTIKYCDSGMFETRLNDANFLLAKITKQDAKTSSIIIESDNTGSVVAAIDLSKNMTGGKMQIEAKLDKSAQSPKISGKYLNVGFAMGKSSFLTAISKNSTFKSVSSKLEQQLKIRFDKTDAEFSMQDGIITLTKAISTGDLLGITAKGKIDTQKHMLDLDGVIVPAYKLNSLFGIKNIPLLGKVITGGEGEGIISAKYKIAGDYTNEKLDIKINALSAITPGFLRNIFNIFPDKEKKE